MASNRRVASFAFSDGVLSWIIALTHLQLDVAVASELSQSTVAKMHLR